ncbi:tyrosine--tRNA ligase cytoplasmic [Anaeramoeba ignava]|uniref:Tyrosine--tRNA ligase cytoplasmic n=1 Tax=Anaeramoeba ignava TaxID=1746090 RepID=A0A9Q0LZ31_ANAIG|nr:tyrosine--tRNA ligase cytoplasmic [Anaeramoeba ignava]
MSATQIVQEKCNSCNYVMTKPFEIRCPICGFKGEKKEEFPIEVFDWSTFKPKEQPQAKKQTKTAPKKKGSKQVQKELSQEELDGLYAQCNIIVGFIENVEEIEKSDSLYHLKINIGNEVKSVVTGLKKSHSIDQINKKKVAVIMNLAKAKLRGVLSEGMILTGINGESIKLLVPPENSEIGEQITLFDRNFDKSKIRPIMNKKNWNKLLEKLKIEKKVATLNGIHLITKSGPITCDLPDGTMIR